WKSHSRGILRIGGPPLGDLGPGSGLWSRRPVPCPAHKYIRSEVQCEQSRGCQFGFLGPRSQSSGEGGRGIYSAITMNGFPKILVLLVFWTSGSMAQNRQLLYDFQEVPQSL